MRHHRLTFLLCLAASTMIPTRGAAQPKGPAAPAPTTVVAATDRARALHIEGARLFELGKYDQAYVAFLAAWALKKHPQIAGNLGDCEMKLGKYRDAAEHYAFAAQDPKPEAKGIAQERLKEAQIKIGTLVVATNPGGAEVLLDGKPRP
jgi:tetratricopeptide (TPR) repeat protein